MCEWKCEEYYMDEDEGEVDEYRERCNAEIERGRGGGFATGITRKTKRER